MCNEVLYSYTSRRLSVSSLARQQEAVLVLWTPKTRSGEVGSCVSGFASTNHSSQSEFLPHEAEFPARLYLYELPKIYSRVEFERLHAFDPRFMELVTCQIDSTWIARSHPKARTRKTHSNQPSERSTSHAIRKHKAIITMSHPNLYRSATRVCPSARPSSQGWLLSFLRYA